MQGSLHSHAERGRWPSVAWPACVWMCLRCLSPHPVPAHLLHPQTQLCPAVQLRCPWLTRAVSPAVPVYNGIIFLFVLANFSMATFMDPGVFPRGRALCWGTASVRLH